MIYIACNIDHNYIEYCGVMLTSLFMHNPDQEFAVYIINIGLTKSDKERILQLTQQYNATIVFCDVSYSLIESFPIRENDHLTLATYLRIFVTQLLPLYIDKVLYVDCDILVVDSIEELWNTNIESYAVAAIQERPPFDIDSAQRLEYPQEQSYFNAGILLINLRRWRQLNMTNLSLNYISNNPNKIVFHDQDVLNALLCQERKFISIRWNLMEFFLASTPEIQPERYEELSEAIKCPAIIHFTGRKKPWMYNCNNPYTYMYIKFARKHNWKVITKTDILRYYIRKYWHELRIKLLLSKRRMIKLPKDFKI